MPDRTLWSYAEFAATSASRWTRSVLPQARALAGARRRRGRQALLVRRHDPAPWSARRPGNRGRLDPG